jgi:hypothetical protein
VFNIKGEDKFKTMFGTFWTIVLIAAILGSFYYYFTKFLDTSNPSVTVTKLADSEYPTVNLTRDNFFFSIYFTETIANVETIVNSTSLS